MSWPGTTHWEGLWRQKRDETVFSFILSIPAIVDTVFYILGGLMHARNLAISYIITYCSSLWWVCDSVLKNIYVYLRLFLNLESSCLSLPNAGSTCMHHIRLIFLLWDGLSCIPNWLPTLYAAKDDLEVSFSCLHPDSSGITDVHHQVWFSLF